MLPVSAPPSMSMQPALHVMHDSLRARKKGNNAEKSVCRKDSAAETVAECIQEASMCEGLRANEPG